MRNMLMVTAATFAAILGFSAGCGGGSGGGGGSSSGGGSSGISSSGQPPVCPYTMCNGACVNTQQSEQNCGACGNVCPGGMWCNNGSCYVDPCNTHAGEALCGSACQNLLYDSNNCGECGHVCPGGQTCQYAECHPPPTLVEGSSSGATN
jgi:hypothetical protein